MKKILLLNGNPKVENEGFDNYCRELSEHLAEQGAQVRAVTLREKKIADCIGCYSCWLKTPGVCPLKDDQEEILKGYVWADLSILASPVIMGFISALVKRSHDRMLPLIHPFLRIDGDRMSHYPRYEKTAKMGLLLDEKDIDGEDIDIIKKVYGRSEFIKTMAKPAKEVADEIYRF